MARITPFKLKLRPPRPRPWHAARPEMITRIVSALDGGASVFITAPAGHGKSALAAEVARSVNWPTAWLTVDVDDDLARFTAHVLAAHETAGLELGAETRLALEEGVPDDELALVLLNDLVDVARDRLLVIDDLHAAGAASIEALVIQLASHDIEGLRLLVASRREPTASLHRMRASGRLLELRGADLALGEEEIRHVLRSRTQTDVGILPVSTVLARTGGWPLAIELVAAAIARGGAVDRSLEQLGADADLLEILSRDVLGSLSPARRREILMLGGFEEVSATLCEAVSRGSDGAGVIAELDRLNALGGALDEVTATFRVHPVWSELLRLHARRELGRDASREAHARASEHYERDGRLAAAVRHALLADDRERAASLLEASAFTMLASGEGDAVIRAVVALGERGASKLLGIATGWALMLTYRWGEARERVGALAPTLTDADGALRGHAFAILGALALVEGDSGTGTELMSAALTCLPPGDPALAVVHGELGIALARRGELRGARASLGAAVAFGPINPLVARAAARELADLELLAGDPEGARRAHEAAIAADPAPLHPSRAALAELDREAGDLTRAERRITELLDAARLAGDAYALVAGLVGRARVAASSGRFDVARDHLAEARVHTSRSRLRVAASGVAALDLLFRLREAGRDADVDGLTRALAELTDLTGGDVNTPAHLLASNVAPELVGLVFARAELVANAPGPAVAALADWRARAEREGRRRSLLEIDLVTAIAAHARGDVSGRERFQEARRAAVQAGFATLASEDDALFARFDASVPRLERAFAASPPGALTRRELEVLELVARGLSTAEAGRSLHVSPATVKKHLENIYGRLGAKNRTQAVALARERGMLP